MTRARALLERQGADVLVVALLVAGLLEIVLTRTTRTPGQVDTLAVASPWLTVPFCFLWTLPLLARRRSSLVAGLAAMSSLTVVALVSPGLTFGLVPFLAVLAMSAAIGFHEERLRAVLGGVALFVLVLVGPARAELGSVGASDLFVILIFSFGPLAVGQVVRDLTRQNAALEARAHELRRVQDELAEAAVAEERTRIANELHDVIAQGVSVMTMHAGGARLLLHQDRDRAREAILAVEEAGREALAETRRLLGVLRSGQTDPQLAPQPGMAALGRHLDSLRDAGHPILVTVEGEPRTLQAGLDLAAYRIVADTLAEGSRLGAKRARIAIRWAPTRLELEIAGDMPARPSRVEPWLATMGERLGLYGATIDYEVLADGFHVVRTHIPLEVEP